MNPRWFEKSYWPLDREIERRAALMDAVRAIPGGDDLAEDDIEGKALLIWGASLSGRDLELSRNRLASQKKSEAELRELEEFLGEMAGAVEDKIASMHRPAISALYAEGDDVFNLARAIGWAREHCRQAFGELDVDGLPRNKTKIQAAMVKETAQWIFEDISGQRATVSNIHKPDTSRHGGRWVADGAFPRFLQSVFDSLQIDASVASQAKAQDR